jgi:alkylation response protein AidB-like acyl-CoA dehydrogenase
MSPRLGADWLIQDTAPADVFTPERLSDEHRLIAQTAAEFVANEVAPALAELENKNWKVARDLVARAGALGLIGVDVPEDVGGVGLDKAASVVVGEAIGEAASFATTFGAQTGLSIIPILCFGTKAQQENYLPRIVSGEIIGAYCLSESGSGSDALSARARAVRQADGSWMLSGEKMWITNGGFADVFIVFAKVDGEHFSAFIVERAFPGVASGKEEHKMGLRGSSTTPVVLQDAKVPADNLLGEVGKGHKIAFNVLNYGRLKLAAMCTGGARGTIGEAAGYAASRRQFDQPIAAFGAIRHKLAEMTIRLYAVESMLFRTTGLIDQKIEALRAGAPSGAGTTTTEGAAVAAALEEYALEASVLKVSSSEMVDFVVDENVQIHGGNGYVADYPAERRYRDARVNRIFEGTNEINRMLVPGILIKRGLKGTLPLIPAAKAVRDELLAVAPPEASGTGDPLGAEKRIAQSLRKTVLVALGLSMETWGEALQNEQEALMSLSDLVIEAFAAESAALRAAQAAGASHPLAGLHADAASVIAHDAGLRAEAIARTLLGSMLTGDALRTSLAGLRRVLKVPAVNTVAARRRIADAVSARRAYPFA